MSLDRRLGRGKTAIVLAALIVAAAVSSSPVDASQPTDSDAWAETGLPSISRGLFTATVLKNGKVLVAGGAITEARDSTASAELFEPATGKWASTGALAVARYRHTATLLDSGKVLVVGGVRDPAGKERLASAELYDPATGKWTGTGPLATPRGLHTATLLENGKVLVVSGAAGEIYDPATGKWAATSPLPAARGGHTATLLESGKVLVAGGFQDRSANPSEIYASATVYDPATDKWTVASGSGGRRSEHTAVALKNGRVLVVGGRTTPGGGRDALANIMGFTATVELFDPAADTWAVTGALPFVPTSHLATALRSGNVLLIGVPGEGTQAAERLSVALYDAETSTWAPVEAAPAELAPGNASQLTLLRDGKVLALAAGARKAAYLYSPPGLGGGVSWGLLAGVVVLATAFMAALVLLLVSRRRRRSRQPARAPRGFATG